jgi:preprotein translocase subunit SecY
LVQAVFWLSYMNSDGASLVMREYQHRMVFWVMGLSALTAGCVFLMWLGEQIDEYGLGNGISLIILAGIVARMPNAILQLINMSDLSVANTDPNTISIGKILVLAALFVFIVAGSILITQAQRRIPIQQAKHTRGRKVYGGQRQYLPLRVNHLCPVVDAVSQRGLRQDGRDVRPEPLGRP